MSVIQNSNIVNNKYNALNKQLISRTEYIGLFNGLVILPPGAYFAVVKLWGAGGGGGSRAENTGGGGGYTTITFSPQSGVSYFASIGFSGVYNGSPSAQRLGGGPVLAAATVGSGGGATTLIQLSGGVHTLIAVAGGGGGGGSAGTTPDTAGKAGAGGGLGGESALGGGARSATGGSTGIGGIGVGTDALNGGNCIITSGTIAGFNAQGLGAGDSSVARGGGGGGFGGGGAAGGIGGAGGGGFINNNFYGFISGDTAGGVGINTFNASDADNISVYGSGGVNGVNGQPGVMVIYLFDYGAIYLGPSYFIDRATATSGINAQFGALTIPSATLSAATILTIPNASSLRITGAPTMGTGATTTNLYSLYIRMNDARAILSTIKPFVNLNDTTNISNPLDVRFRSINQSFVSGEVTLLWEPAISSTSGITYISAGGTAGRFTFTLSGFYFISCSRNLGANTGSVLTLFIERNGTKITEVSKRPSTRDNFIHINTLVYIKAPNDFIQCRIYIENASSIPGSSTRNLISICKLF